MVTVFWPTDVNSSGYCYGWTSPVICVAGVLPVDNVENAMKLINQSQALSKLEEDCGSTPTIIGTCRVQSKPLMQVEFSLLEDGSDHPQAARYNIIYFVRHEFSSMRFYSLDIEGYTQPCEDVRQHPVQALSPRGNLVLEPLVSGIDQIALRQFNHSKMLEDLLSVNPNLHRRTTPGFKLDAFFLPAVITLFAGRMNCLWAGVPRSMFLSSPLYFAIFSALKDASATVQQIFIRVEQAKFLSRKSEILIRRRDTSTTRFFSSQYINFYNSVWLISNDFIVGAAFGAFLCENNVVLAKLVSSAFEYILIHWIQASLIWLDSWPAGLKLNTELSRFYCFTFIHLMGIWGYVVGEILRYLPTMLYIIGVISYSGFTMALSILSDLLCLSTAHTYVCYVIAATVYHHTLKTANSLWNLFRGKRYNVLRNRIDPWDYDVDQLLFGTILFTLVTFLFPTILAYYALFAMLRLTIILAHALTEAVLAFINHFPLFALVLRVKDPWRLPGGVYFDYKPSPTKGITILIAKNQPVPLGSIFSQYAQLWARLSSHYHPMRLMSCILSGAYLAVISQKTIHYELGN